MKPHLRVIVVSHLNDKTKDGLYKTVTHVLRTKKMPIEERLKLRSKLGPYKNEFRHLSQRNASKRSKEQVLAQLGAGPMTHVIKSAIPLLLDLLPK